MALLKAHLLKILLLVFAFSFFTLPAHAQIVINEFLANPNEGNEWIELYYSGEGETIDLEGYWFDDDNNLTLVEGEPQTGTEDPGSDPIPVLGIIEPGSFLLFDLSKSSYLNNNGDSPSLFDSSGSLLDSFEYSESVEKNKTYGRTPDGNSNWSSGLDPTPGAINSSPPPSPTPKSTPTPKPKSSSTPTSTPKPTPTQTPTSKLAQSSTVSKSTPKKSATTSSILGITSFSARPNKDNPEETTDDSGEDQSTTKSKTYPLFFIASGLTFTLAAITPQAKQLISKLHLW